MHPTGGSLRVFGQFVWLEPDSAKIALSRPAHQRVTLTVSPLVMSKVCSKQGNVNMNNKIGIAKRVFLLILLILLSGCGSSQVNELSNNTVSYNETIHINNCGGKADSEQTVSHSFATTIEGKAEISAQYKSIIEGSISAKYSQYRNVTKSQKLTAPPATNMEFVLRWSEDVHSGNVTVNGTTGIYEVRVPVAVEQVSSQDLGCDGSLLVLNIRPACGYSYTVESGKAIELHYGGWYAKGLVLATDNANHLTVTLFVDGQEIPGIEQPVQPVTASSYPGADCTPSRDYSNAFGVFYIANIGTLPSGEHSVQVIYSFDKQVTDGGYDDNGNPAVYGPGELDLLQFTIVASP